MIKKRKRIFLEMRRFFSSVILSGYLMIAVGIPGRSKVEKIYDLFLFSKRQSLFVLTQVRPAEVFP